MGHPRKVMAGTTLSIVLDFFDARVIVVIPVKLPLANLSIVEEVFCFDPISSIEISIENGFSRGVGFGEEEISMGRIGVALFLSLIPIFDQPIG